MRVYGGKASPCFALAVLLIFEAETESNSKVEITARSYRQIFRIKRIQIEWKSSGNRVARVFHSINQVSFITRCVTLIKLQTLPRKLLGKIYIISR